MTKTLRREFFKVYRGHLAPYLAETEALHLYVSILRRRRGELGPRDIKAIEGLIRRDLDEYGKLKEQFSIPELYAGRNAF